jgi:hypothetical protein
MDKTTNIIIKLLSASSVIIIVITIIIIIIITITITITSTIILNGNTGLRWPPCWRRMAISCTPSPMRRCRLEQIVN